MDKYSELEKMNELKEKGVITEAEFLKMKADLLKGEPQDSSFNTSTLGKGLSVSNDKDISFYMHLSQYLGWLLPIAGWIAPIVLWQTNKDKSKLIDVSGVNITNWIISNIIYISISLLLSLILIGYLFLMVLFVLNSVYPIIGALKAKQGEVWRYPGTINFLKS